MGLGRPYTEVCNGFMLPLKLYMADLNKETFINLH